MAQGKKQSMPTCFIIMPITTPKNHLLSYGDDKDHFIHVLDELFIPAVKSAGLDPIPPVAKGAELIQAEIINNLESSDIVLCDMSILNPNVFFELGIRTALNKPICLVRDDLTEILPFDMSGINYHTYKCDLASWIVKQGIIDLKIHIQASQKSSPKENALWSYFSMSLSAKPAEKESGVDAKVNFLNVQIEGLHRKLDHLGQKLQSIIDQHISGEIDLDVAMDTLHKLLLKHTVGKIVAVIDDADNKIDITVSNLPPVDVLIQIQNYANKSGIKVNISEYKKTNESPK